MPSEVANSVDGRIEAMNTRLDELQSQRDRYTDSNLAENNPVIQRLDAEIARVNPGVKVIFTSGYTADVFPKNEIAGKGMYFLAKPIVPGELLRFVRGLLDGKPLWPGDGPY